MRLQKIYPVLIAFLALCVCRGIMAGQDTADKLPANPTNRIPGLASKHLMALGKRMHSIGKEKTTYAGQLFDKDGNSVSARVVHDLYGLVQLEGFGNKGESISYDGVTTRVSVKGNKDKDAVTQKEEDLLEVFVTDTVEGMMDSLRNDAAVRFLGNGFGPDPRVEPDYKGPRYDIYEVTIPVRCRKDQVVRTKRYYFDNKSGLLLSTRYYDRSGKTPIKLETRYSAWGDIDGSKYPARIEHYVDGKLQFDFIAESIRGDASGDKSAF
jgi:hypothetical protein